jgi:hypothetical protein
MMWVRLWTTYRVLDKGDADKNVYLCGWINDKREELWLLATN